MILGWKVVKRTKGVKPFEADLFTGKDVIDADEKAWLAKAAERKANGERDSWLYRHTLGYLF